MQRSLKYLKDRGWQCAIVEKWIAYPAAVQQKLGIPGIRVDVWGFGDILACRTVVSESGRAVRQIALFQTTDMSSLSKHRTKAESVSELALWKEAGGLAVLHAWAKRGERGKRKTWQLTHINL